MFRVKETSPTNPVMYTLEDNKREVGEKKCYEQQHLVSVLIFECNNESSESITFFTDLSDSHVDFWNM